MQTFIEKNDKNKEETVNSGDFEVKIVKASSLKLGTHRVRFWPLSKNFYEGADYVSIVQYFHWLNRRPVVCIQESYDYSVPDTETKTKIGKKCVICSDKFVWYKKAKELKETDPVKSEQIKKIAGELNEKISACSIVSLVDKNGVVGEPFILRYTKQLLLAIGEGIERVLSAKDINIADPQKGYIFDIIIKIGDGGHRNYASSTPSVDLSPVDITKLEWNWKEVCEAIKSEIKPIPSEEEVKTFYFDNYGKNQENSTFSHPSFQDNVSNVIEEPFSASKIQEEPISDNRNTNHTHNKLVKSKLYNCNSQCGGSGFDAVDENCKECDQIDLCRGTNDELFEEEEVFNKSDIEAKLNAINEKINRN